MKNKKRQNNFSQETYRLRRRKKTHNKQFKTLTSLINLDKVIMSPPTRIERIY